MRVLYLFFLLLASNAGIAQKTKTHDRFAGLDTLFQRVLQEWKAPGFAVAVVEKGDVIYAKGFGYRDYEGKIPVTVNTQFAIGSCTKAFTASLLGILRKDAKVDFDKPATEYIPRLKFFNGNLTENVTLKDMMTHRTGLPRHDFSWYLWPSSNTDSLIERIQYFKPSHDLREKWQYNNWMYFLQGVVAEKVTDKSWNENIREYIFNPLGMTQSNTTRKDHELYKENALGYSLVKDSIIDRLDFYDIGGVGAAGSINSTVTDMAKWLKTWIMGGKYQGKEVLPAAYVQEAITAQMAIGGGLPSAQFPDIYFSQYGYGWMMSSYRGHYRVEHGGNIDGFSASTSFFPSDSIGIVVLVNQDGSAVPGVVRNILSDRLLKLPRKDWQTIQRQAAEKAKKMNADAEKSKTKNQKTHTTTSHSLTNYEGNYNNPGYGTLTISLKNDSLFAHATKEKLYLRHFHYDVFEVFQVSKKFGIDTTTLNLKFKFYMNDGGDIAGLKTQLEPTVEDLDFVKKLDTMEVSKDSLKAYIGEYLLGITIKIYLKGDAALYMFVPGQPEYELQYLGNDRFALKNLPGYYVQFLRNEEREVVEFIAQQPNGNFKAKRK